MKARLMENALITIGLLAVAGALYYFLNVLWDTTIAPKLELLLRALAVQ